MGNSSNREISTEFSNNKVLVVLSKKYYEKEAVFTAANKYTDKCSIVIEPIETEKVGISFQLKPGANGDLEEISSDFCNEALDQQVRIDLEKRYGKIRELIVRQAFLPITKSEQISKKEG